eukprot:GDKK01071597.1.p1 GENE.GDKK01071597.1~~GDKK01071597.1.p1  ORF type:complete len:196 (+),score=37.86 GDKK01071597.1:1-588(+)
MGYSAKTRSFCHPDDNARTSGEYADVCLKKVATLGSSVYKEQLLAAEGVSIDGKGINESVEMTSPIPQTANSVRDGFRVQSAGSVRGVAVDGTSKGVSPVNGIALSSPATNSNLAAMASSLNYGSAIANHNARRLLESGAFNMLCGDEDGDDNANDLVRNEGVPILPLLREQLTAMVEHSINNQHQSLTSQSLFK